MKDLFSIIFSLVIIEVAVRISRIWLCSSWGEAANVFDTKVTFLGVIHHELSHSLFAILTGAKIRNMTLFHYNKATGSLGQVIVETSRNKVLSAIQCFFISIAPLITACFSCSLLSWLLLSPWLNGEISFTMLIMTWEFWVFLIIATPIIYHADLSKEDLLCMLKGCWFIILAIMFIALFSPQGLAIMVLYITKLRNMTLSLMLIPIVIGFIVRGIK